MADTVPDKKLYWLIESNGDLSITCVNIETCMQLLDSDWESLDEDEQQQTEYTIMPMWYTDEEFENLPEAE